MINNTSNDFPLQFTLQPTQTMFKLSNINILLQTVNYRYIKNMHAVAEK
jgi:hypothetical protein